MDKFVKNLRASSTPSKTHEKFVKKSTKGSKKSPKMIQPQSSNQILSSTSKSINLESKILNFSMNENLNISQYKNLRASRLHTSAERNTLGFQKNMQDLNAVKEQLSKSVDKSKKKSTNKQSPIKIIDYFYENNQIKPVLQLQQNSSEKGKQKQASINDYLVKKNFNKSLFKEDDDISSIENISQNDQSSKTKYSLLDPNLSSKYIQQSNPAFQNAFIYEGSLNNQDPTSIFLDKIADSIEQKQDQDIFKFCQSIREVLNKFGYYNDSIKSKKYNHALQMIINQNENIIQNQERKRRFDFDNNFDEYKQKQKRIDNKNIKQNQEQVLSYQSKQNLNII